MDLSLAGKTAVITGPAKGMGAAISRAFADEGCRLALLGRDVAAVAAVSESIVAGGGVAQVISCDITRAEDCASAARLAAEILGGSIDILVHVAGGSGPIGKSGVETSSEEFQDILEVNVTGAFHMIRAIAPFMIARGSGKIVLVGGTFGMRGKAGRTAYSASKWGLRGLTKSFALELGPHNINVNCVAPGMVDGPRFREKVCRDMALKLGIGEAEAARRHAEDYALRRISTDRDVANACLFLASDVARQITGIDLPVDGGWAAL